MTHAAVRKENITKIYKRGLPPLQIVFTSACVKIFRASLTWRGQNTLPMRDLPHTSKAGMLKISASGRIYQKA